MMCHRMGRFPIGTIGLGMVELYSLIRVPRPPQRMIVGIDWRVMSSPQRGAVPGDRAVEPFFEAVGGLPSEHRPRLLGREVLMEDLA